MNINILAPRRKRREAGIIRKILKLVEDYRYFRSRGFHRRAAWWCAKNTVN